MKIIFPIALLGLLTACGGPSHEIEPHTGEVTSTITAGSQSEQELDAALEDIRKEEEERVADAMANSTTLTFDKLKHDFGDVGTISENTTLFTVTNTGKIPLIIEEVTASCGCTTPIKPEGPIAPGESDVIEVTFTPKPGQLNEIKKTVTVQANTLDQVHILEIRAFVK
ncbi:MAG: DUF1573 domain-containing protein [Crocinitomicaceae bacterium]|nr:DUF1573 domain-containing protein [Crocinitomicaceae bacterium]